MSASGALTLAAAVLANALWGTSFLASKYALESWGPFTASALRFVLASLFLYVGMAFRKEGIRRPARKELGALALIALSGFGLLYPLQLSGLLVLPSGLSAVIMLSSPLFVLFCGSLFFGQKLNAASVLAITLGALGGYALLCDRDLSLHLNGGAFRGVLLTAAASVSLALSVLFTRRLRATMDAANVTFWSMTMGAGMLTLFALLAEGVPSPASMAPVSSWAAILFLSLVCSALCFFLWNYSMTASSPLIASTMHVKTPVAILLGVLVKDERVTGPMLAGTALVIAGVIITSLPQRKERAT